MKVCALVLSCVFHVALACTWVGVSTKDGKDVIGRTLELHGKAAEKPHSEDPIMWDLMKMKAGTAVDAAESSGATCIAAGERLTKWTTKYSYVGIAGSGPPFVSSTLNTEGLSVDEQTLVQSAYMRPPQVEDNSTRVCFHSLTEYLAGSFASVADLRTALESKDRPFYIVAGSGSGIHWAIADRFHENIVIEVVKGVLNIHNNTVRVMTNDPPFDFHLHNLQHFANLNTNWPDRSDITVDSEVGAVPTQDCHGTNLLGLPGDFTPSSRFAKTFYLRQFAETNIDIENVDEAISLVQGLINSVHIPKGVVAFAKRGSDTNYDFTQVVTMKNLQDRMFYFRTYDDMQWRAVELDKVLWTNNSTRVPAFDQGPRDITGTF